MMPRLFFLMLIALAGLPFVVGVWVPVARPTGLLLTMIVLITAIIDLVLSASPARIEVRREAPEVMSVGAQNSVKVWLTNRNRTTVILEVHDEPPSPCSMTDLPYRIELMPNRNRYFVYHILPQRRGRNSFGQIFLRCRSRFSFWTLYDERLITQPVRIYPDIQAVHGVELLARKNRLAQAGVRMSQLRGRGNEFERLREYRREDEYRNIDWKATAKHQQLISREYVVERNQHILLLLDCGRSMCNEHEGVTHFDRALNAAILLSYIALRQGDSVGILVASNRVRQWVPPLRGRGAIQKLIRHTYELQPDYEASDYALMVEELRRRHRKRSLVILLTHALDEVHLTAIGDHILQLRSPHLVLGAFLRNVPLVNRLNSIPQTDLDAFQIAAAADLVAAQTAQITRLEKKGLLVVETVPEQLSTQLINRYLDIKARHLL